jgi:hypothetical protein
VAAFFRLHPLLKNESWLPGDARVVHDRHTVFVPLEGGAAQAWNQADGRHRNMVNKGKRLGVRVDWDDGRGWDDFELLYRESMERLDAPDRLRFSPRYFAGLKDLPGTELAVVRSGGELVAGAVFMFGSRWAHYHLSAYRPGAGNQLTSCVLQAAVERAADRGLAGLHLGGGRTNRPDDSLLKFKLSLGGTLLDFFVALVIVNSPAFANLCEAWAAAVGHRPQWLLGYRQPKPAFDRQECGQAADTVTMG